MLYQITDGTVSLGGTLILSHIQFEIKGKEKIAVVGKNGAGKSTLLRLIAGELSLDRDDRRQSPGIFSSRKLTVGMLGQQTFLDTERTVEEELLMACPDKDLFSRERYEYEREYDVLFTEFGFEKGDKKKRLEEFSGGEQTKIALIRLLLEKPDILLLDEPTNHLDLETCGWLERYLRRYDRAVVMVSHDRFFLDRTAEVVYELEQHKLTRYPGNYTQYREEKQKAYQRQKKAYERQQEEIRRLEGLVERFKHKPTKAAFARTRKKQMERMERIEKPQEDSVFHFTAPIEPAVRGGKWVLEAEHAKIGYERQLMELSLRVKRGQKIGILGKNGVGKTTFLKTAAGFLPVLDGKLTLGPHITIGYFDQHTARIQSEKTVLEHFHDLFPSMPEKEVRGVLASFLFGGRDAARPVNGLSGGEKARLVLAELLQSRPNLLILDEPTNHMDIQARETLESAFQAYTGTILFVSHDRYFIRQTADAVLIFENQTAFYYPFGYEHYVERKEREQEGESIAAQVKAEDQALLADLRAVPRGERHRLREISTEEAYQDWRLSPALERMELAGERFAGLWRQMEEMEQSWRQTAQFWMDVGAEWLADTRPDAGPECLADGWAGGQSDAGPDAEHRRETDWRREREMLQAECQEAWELWHESCLEWLDVYEAVRDGEV